MTTKWFYYIFLVKYENMALYQIHIPKQIKRSAYKKVFFFQIVKSTWAKAAGNIIYVSEEEDPTNGTVVLPGY